MGQPVGQVIGRAFGSRRVGRRVVAGGLWVKIARASAVMPTDCSNGADSERSRVIAVQPSSSISTRLQR